MFNRAILKLPAKNFANGLTSVDLGAPDYLKALQQHQTYQRILVECGLDLLVLPSDPEFPDSTFVEDTAILVNNLAILTNPGAASRLGEVASIKPTLENFFQRLESISFPGTLDGGDICEADGHFFIGISKRTNESGAMQFSSILNREGYSTEFIDIRKGQKFLHLKSGLAYLGDKTLVVAKVIADHPALRNFHLILVEDEEQYAANCLLVNDFVLVPQGYPRITSKLQEVGYKTKSLDMSEFRKMDGGLSCLSLRFYVT